MPSDLTKPQRIHVVGAGGAGMGAIASVLRSISVSIMFGSVTSASVKFLVLNVSGALAPPERTVSSMQCPVF